MNVTTELQNLRTKLAQQRLDVSAALAQVAADEDLIEAGFVHWLAAVQTAIVALDEAALDDEERE